MYDLSNPYLPAMQANAAAAQRRQAMARRLLQPQWPQPPEGQPMMTVGEGGGSMPGAVNPLGGVNGQALGSALGEAMNRWLGSSGPNTTGMGVQMGGFY